MMLKSNQQYKKGTPIIVLDGKFVTGTGGPNRWQLGGDRLMLDWFRLGRLVEDEGRLGSCSCDHVQLTRRQDTSVMAGSS